MYRYRQGSCARAYFLEVSVKSIETNDASLMMHVLQSLSSMID